MTGNRITWGRFLFSRRGTRQSRDKEEEAERVEMNVMAQRFSARGGAVRHRLLTKIPAARLSKEGGIMATACTYENDTDRKQHLRAIQMLAKDLRIPEEEVQLLYETMLCSLKEQARIKDYLAILISRNVKDIIKGGS